jgi:propionyl-CoA carboxylase alpha chain
VRSVLVANRGEIARRVFRTCRRLGLASVAVFSDADADAPHVREADAAVRLPGASAAETYLRVELLIDAARRAGADAVHPGYGFLSENAGFARAVQDAGLTWIGPPPDAIAAMGSKIEAKRLMSRAGVPVLAALDPAALRDGDLPVLVKASAGGGGRGMRTVRDLDALPAELAAARAEAQAAFGDPTVFCEPYLATARHIEVQVFADSHGTVWAIGERECSIQRRHQKVIEEAPSPLVDRLPGMRDALFEAARAATKVIGYTGAGTVEFLADDTGRFFLLEMNTRLQVEHPVTECTTGLDLVALQLEVAAGGRLAADPPAPSGHAIEARLYAEDPRADWQPQTGRLHRLDVPGVTAAFEAPAVPSGLRLDSGVQSGSDVSVHYDPMLAKLIAWAPTRQQAARTLSAALSQAAVHGVTTNRDLLVNVLRHKAFLGGDTDTAFFDRHGLDTLAAPLVADDDTAVLAAALALDAARPRSLDVPSGWRNVPSQPQQITLGGCEVRFRYTRQGLDAAEGVELVSARPELVVLDVDGVRRRYAVARYGDTVYVDTADGGVHFEIAARFHDPAAQLAAGSLVAPMPGTVARIAVAEGDRVRAGQPVLWLEAMKMQHQLTAPADGVVTELRVHAGQQIEVGAVLAIVNEEDA